MHSEDALPSTSLSHNGLLMLKHLFIPDMNLACFFLFLVEKLYGGRGIMNFSILKIKYQCPTDELY